MGTPSGNSTVMGTPMNNHNGHNIWQTPPSASIPSRKREYSAANLADDSRMAKSQRTTPIPGSQGFDSSPLRSDQGSESVEIIDLTGDDVTAEAERVAQQIREDELRNQAIRDFEATLSDFGDLETEIQLANPDGSGASFITDVLPPEAFSKITPFDRRSSSNRNRRPRARPRTRPAPQPTRPLQPLQTIQHSQHAQHVSPSPPVHHMHHAQPGQPGQHMQHVQPMQHALPPMGVYMGTDIGPPCPYHNHTMPGAFLHGWDPPFPSHSMPVTPQHQMHSPQPFQNMPQSAPDPAQLAFGSPTHVFDANNFPMPGAFPSHMEGPMSSPTPFHGSTLPHAPQTPHAVQTLQVPQASQANQTPQSIHASQVAQLPQPEVPVFPGFAPASSPLHQPPPAAARPGQGSTSLMDIITSTNGLDSFQGVDGNGNPLPERFNNFMKEAAQDPRVSPKELDDLLKNIRPDMDILEKNREGTPAGLKQPLYPHQEYALTWMGKQEKGSSKGGILADDMGLGKTISTLALMLSRPSKDRVRTNLIIGPLSLMRQWEEEISKKTKLSHRLSVFLYHNKKTTTEKILKYDVVLTTYGTIAQELKRLDQYRWDNKDRNIDWNDSSLSVKCPLLHPTKAIFYRVILDEAQCIKNKDTQTAKACHALRSTYRWCLTGTPMMNSIIEMFSLLTFLRIKPYSDWDNFRSTFGELFGRKGETKISAMRKFRTLLKAVMMRRKKNSLLNGKPILTLPEKTEELVYAELSADEHDFYQQLEKKSQVQFSKYLREGSIGKNYSNILVLLLRLRQACCHPHLNLDVDDISPIGTEDMVELVKSLDNNIVERIKNIDGFECPICQDGVPCPSFFVPCGHDSCRECLTRLVADAQSKNLQEGHESDKAKCPMCRGMFDPKKCFTYDVFRKVHMKDSLTLEELAEDDEEEDSDDSDSDSEEDGPSDDVDEHGNLKDFIVADEDEGDGQFMSKLTNGDFMAQADQAKEKPKKKKNKGKKKKTEIRPSMLKSLRQEAIKNREAYKRYMRYLRKKWMPAAKVTECLKLLTEIQETGEKTIIFSQWTLLLDLIQVAMHHEKLPEPVRYDGRMSGEERNNAAQMFREKPEMKVMLVSLRAGNAGLNLTAASRVIIMDPFWNPYIEMQAVDRAYRIGQTKEVKVYRILTRETVEDRIVALQDKKKAIVEAALDETESMKIGRLSIGELKSLFNVRD